jgi:hypothetical protein
MIAPIPISGEVRRFFQLFTRLCALYFLAKALDAWLGATMPLTEAITPRSLNGGVSLAVLSAISMTQGLGLFFLCRRLALLPHSQTASEEIATS